MRTLKYSLLVGAVMASIAIGAEPKGAAEVGGMHHKMVDPASITWGPPPPGLPPGAKFAVLSGNPEKKGVYTVRLSAPAGYRVMPHTHPTAEFITVLSGTFHMGTGAKFDEKTGYKMTAGSFMDMPAGMKHYAWSSKPTVIQVTAEGPFKIVYVNPADDPRNAKKK